MCRGCVGGRVYVGGSCRAGGGGGGGDRGPDADDAAGVAVAPPRAAPAQRGVLYTACIDGLEHWC